MSKEDFKIFAKQHPELLKYIRSNEMTWQKFYEIYDVYGEREDAWKPYLTTKTSQSIKSTENSETAFKDLLNMVKGIDLATIQRGIGGLQKAIGLVQELGGNTKKQSIPPQKEYEPRPMYKYFED